MQSCIHRYPKLCGIYCGGVRMQESKTLTYFDSEFEEHFPVFLKVRVNSIGLFEFSVCKVAL